MSVWYYNNLTHVITMKDLVKRHALNALYSTEFLFYFIIIIILIYLRVVQHWIKCEQKQALNFIIISKK